MCKNNQIKKIVLVVLHFFDLFFVHSHFTLPFTVFDVLLLGVAIRVCVSSLCRVDL